MAQVNAYLMFNGNCAEAFGFYKSVFGGEFRAITKFGDIPPMPGMELPEEAKERIMHVALPISNETILMGGDAHPAMGQVTFGQNMSLSVSTASKEEAETIFAGLSEGGKITMPIGDTFWGAYFGMFVDKFAVDWMVGYDYPKN